MSDEGLLELNKSVAELARLFQRNMHHNENIHILVMSMAFKLDQLVLVETKRNPEFTNEMRAGLDDYLGRVIDDDKPDIFARVRKSMHESLDEIDQKVAQQET